VTSMSGAARRTPRIRGSELDWIDSSDEQSDDETSVSTLKPGWIPDSELLCMMAAARDDMSLILRIDFIHVIDLVSTNDLTDEAKAAIKKYRIATSWTRSMHANKAKPRSVVLAWLRFYARSTMAAVGTLGGH
jgi:hypothetical protein